MSVLYSSREYQYWVHGLVHGAWFIGSVVDSILGAWFIGSVVDSILGAWFIGSVVDSQSKQLKQNCTLVSFALTT